MSDSIELLEDVLFWTPELDVNERSENVVDALELVSDDGQWATYCVQHYSVKAVGGAFGPLGLDHTIQFCRRLSALLANRTSDQSPLMLTSPPEDFRSRTNACVLVGAYLVLCQQWSAARVAEVVGRRDATCKFPCSWAKPGCTEAGWLMSTTACWQGLEVALKFGWIDSLCLGDDVHMTMFCHKYRHMVMAYDATWIVPAKLLVSADPVTTAHDPNPETFADIWGSMDYSPRSECTAKQYDMAMLDPNDDAGSDGTDEHPCVRVNLHQKLSTAGDTTCKRIVDIDLGAQSVVGRGGTMHEPLSSLSRNSVDSISDATTIDERPVREITALSLASVETVCKPYSSASSYAHSESKKAFVHFLQECGVRLVIRCNYSEEQGMPASSYDRDRLQNFGIEHQDLRFIDKDGGLPKHSTVVDLLRAFNGGLGEYFCGAALIHCKGGFGRSMILACCLIIHEFDIPGQALLGWVRIARPGAITTPQQEEFLISLNGRRDVMRIVGTARIKKKNAQHRCSSGCVVQ